MPIQKIKPDTHFVLPFDLPRSRRSVDLFVESDLPVRAFILDEDQLTEFRAGKRYEIYGSTRISRRQEKRIQLPAGTWYFVIVNESNESVSVFYELT
jgi:hypothetical protein